MDLRAERPAGPYPASLRGGVGQLRASHTVSLARHFGIKPWEIDRLTVEEFIAFCDAVDHIEQGG